MIDSKNNSVDNIQSKVSVTVMIKTLNEEINIEDAILSFPKGTPIIVFDSYSSDHTVEIAIRCGARLVQRKWDDESTHMNWAVQNIDFNSQWVLQFDGDERMTPALWAEILRAVSNPGNNIAFEIRHKDIFMGTWIRHSTFYPCWHVRLFRPQKAHWERLINPIVIVDGDVGRIQEHFIHYPFSKGTVGWFRRHVHYADCEAQEVLKSAAEPLNLLNLFIGSYQLRRHTLKRFYYRMPLRPMLRFLTLFLLKRGFLDGRAGYYYARMQAAYELMISIRAMELRRLEKGLPI